MFGGLKNVRIFVSTNNEKQNTMTTLTKTQNEVIESLPLKPFSFAIDKNYKNYRLCYKSVNDRTKNFQERSVKSLIKKGILTSAKDEKGFTIIIKK